MPGTHDITLASQTLRELRCINDGRPKEVKIPIFDKSLHSGEGDRLPKDKWNVVSIKDQERLDLVVLEGWCLGFSPISLEEARRRFDEAGSSQERLSYTLSEVLEVNEKLEKYLDLWAFLDVLVQVYFSSSIFVNFHD